MKQPNADIIIIKGAPASGKSQSAKELAKYFTTGVRIEIDNLRSMVISVDWTNQKQHIDVLNSSLKLIESFYSNGFKPVIIIDTFSGDKINNFFQQLSELKPEWSISIFGLFTQEIELKRRLKNRASDKFKDFVISKKLNKDTLKYRHKLEIQIDTTSLKPEETAKIIYQNLSS
jgi:tRNA A37 N6-isopentenylltransferase MiaA